LGEYVIIHSNVVRKWFEMMKNPEIKKQINKLYLISALEGLPIAAASWVALLAARGFSIGEIGILEAVFHAVSLCGEIPSGVLADVLGRKKTMIASRLMRVFSAVLMIFSDGFFGAMISIAILALSYNLASGTREALAFDSLKKFGKEEEYDKYASTEMVIYRICSAVALLLAGFSLYLGYKKAYAVDVVLCLVGVFAAFLLTDAGGYEKNPLSFKARVIDCVKESLRFLKENPKAGWLILLNSFIGAVSVLLLYFLQAKLPEFGLPDTFLGPALFVMTLGAVLGSKVIQYCKKWKYGSVLAASILGILFGLASLFFKNPWIVILGGFISAFSDDFIQVRFDVVLNNMIPSEQRATLISICSFSFSLVMIILSPIMGYLLELL